MVGPLRLLSAEVMVVLGLVLLSLALVPCKMYQDKVSQDNDRAVQAWYDEHQDIVRRAMKAVGR